MHATPHPAPDADVARRFSGLERLYGVDGAARVRAAHVLVVGIGGVGSWSAEALARSGVGRLTLIDLDHVAESNINRQIHALESTIGQAKVLAMQERIAQINPECRVTAIDEFVEPDNWLQLLDSARQGGGEVTAVIDCCDQLKAKLMLAQWARETKARFITVGAAGGKRQAHKVDIDDLAQVTHDPLLAQLRQRLRKTHGAPREGRKIGVACVFSRESVAPPDASCAIEDADGTLNCHGYGSVVAVTATFGQCAAGWAIDEIARSSKL
ncbi:MAG TPA: tRNA threonylcarbamoyladenosine dehydratase [Variovorax sp.]|nr:tRNA threonylcarbamoyladenosine dehydratase [Variovorax sp.]